MLCISHILYIHRYIHALVKHGKTQHSTPTHAMRAFACASKQHKHTYVISTHQHKRCTCTRQFDIGLTDQDDEASFVQNDLSDRVGAVYGDAKVPTNRRVFVVIMLDEEGRDAVAGTVKRLRERFPLDGKELDKILRWVDRSVNSLSSSQMHPH
jgi:hypothetical protein